MNDWLGYLTPKISWMVTFCAMQDTYGFHDGTNGGKMFPELEIAKESVATTVVRKVTNKKKVVRIGFLIVVSPYYWIVI